MQNTLYIEKECVILNFANKRCSILVRSAVSEEGPKNPLKGITVKPLVPASYAQFGVGAEWKAHFCACVGRAFPNGMWKPTLPARRPDLVHGRTPLWYFRPVYESGWNLHCGATRPSSRERCVQSSLPCVEGCE